MRGMLRSRLWWFGEHRGYGGSGRVPGSGEGGRFPRAVRLTRRLQSHWQPCEVKTVEPCHTVRPCHSREFFIVRVAKAKAWGGMPDNYGAHVTTSGVVWLRSRTETRFTNECACSGSQGRAIGVIEPTLCCFHPTPGSSACTVRIEKSFSSPLFPPLTLGRTWA